MKFNIQHIDKRHSFEFDINLKLKAFREDFVAQVELVNWSYALGANQKNIIYSNDNASLTLRELFTLYNPELLNLNEITLKTEEFSMSEDRKTERHGIALIAHDKREQFKSWRKKPSEITCGLSRKLLEYPIKINGYYYEIEALSAFLADAIFAAFSKTTVNELRSVEVKCPRGKEIPSAVLHPLLDHIKGKQKGGLILLTPQLIRNYLGIYFKCPDQAEYDNLLLSSYAQMIELSLANVQLVAAPAAPAVAAPAVVAGVPNASSQRLGTTDDQAEKPNELLYQLKLCRDKNKASANGQNSGQVVVVASTSSCSMQNR